MVETFTVDITGSYYRCRNGALQVLYTGSNALTAIQTGIDTGVAGDTVHLETGSYPVASQIHWHTGINMSSDNDATIDFSTTPTQGATLIKMYETTPYTATLSITGNLSKGGYSLTTTTAHGASIGDLIFIRSTDEWRGSNYNNQYKGEIRKVTRTGSGNTLYFERGFEDDYTGTTVTLWRLKSMKDITIDGVSFYNSNCARHSNPTGSVRQLFICFYVKYAENIHFTDCIFDGMETYGIRMDSVIDSTVDNSEFKYSTRYGYGYGVMCAYACQNIIIEHNDALECRHAFVLADGGADYGIPRHITGRHNRSVDSVYWDPYVGSDNWKHAHHYDAHPIGEDINFIDNEATGSGMGMWYQSYSGKILKNNIHDLGDYNSVGIGVGISTGWYDDWDVLKYQDEVLIDGNTVKDTSIQAILLGWEKDAPWQHGAVDRMCRNIIVSNNNLSNFGTYGILAVNSAYCLINKNNISGSAGDTGIYLYNSCNDIQGSENAFSGCDTNIKNSGSNCLDADGGYVTLFSQDYSALTGVPSNIHEYSYGASGSITITDEGDYIQAVKAGADINLVQIYGFRNQIKCRYEIDLAWETDGVNVYIGGIQIYFYGTGAYCKYRATYQNTGSVSQYLPSVDGQALGSNNRVTLVVDTNLDGILTDDSKGYAWVYITAGATTYSFQLPQTTFNTRQDWFETFFTPSVLNILPDDTAVVKIYSVKQSICTPTFVTGIGSNKYQSIGYDGPHSYPTLAARMNKINDADMGATIWADTSSWKNFRDDVVNDPEVGDTFLGFLQYLIASGSGWDLGQHFNPSDGAFTNFDTDTGDQADIITEYASLIAEFGYAPRTWCWLGAAPTRYSAEYVSKNCDGMVNRSWASLNGAQNFTDTPTDYSELMKNAANGGYAGYTLYMHETDITPAIASSVEPATFDTWFSAITGSGVKLIGHYGWYMIQKNQKDLLFYSGIPGDTTIVKVNTNGYNSMVVVKRDIDYITLAGNPITFETTPEGWVIFEAVDNGEYTLGIDIEPPTDPSSGHSGPVIGDALMFSMFGLNPRK